MIMRDKKQKPDRSNELGIAERVRTAVKKGSPFVQAQMLGPQVVPQQRGANTQQVKHR